MKPEVRFEVDENEHEYVLSVYKPVSEETLSKAIYEKLQKVREERQPRYQLVRDFFGNEYYVQDHEDEEMFMRHAIANLDLAPIKRQVAKKVFRDYEITLSHGGDELVIASRKDRLHKAFSLGVEVDDVRVNGFDMISESVGVLRIGITKPRQEQPVCQIEFRTTPCKLIEGQKSVSDNEASEDEDEEIQRQVAAAQEQLRQQKAAEAAEAAEQTAIEEQRQRAREAVRMVMEEQRREAEAAERAQLEKQREEEASRKAARREEKKIAKEKLRKEKHKAAIAEKKASLIEQKRKNRELQQLQKKEKEAESSTQNSESPQNVVININISTPAQNNKKSEESRGRSRSPVVLEDVDDEEEFRYRRSLGRSPRGSSVIDDM